MLSYLTAILYYLFLLAFLLFVFFFFFFQAEDGIRDKLVTGVQTCALPIFLGQEIARDRRRRGSDLRVGRFPGQGPRAGVRRARRPARPHERGRVRLRDRKSVV